MWSDDLRRILLAAEGVVAPSISALILARGEPVFTHAAERVYDLASLTKVLCTTEVALRLAAEGRLALDAAHPLLPPGVTPRLCLQHSAGFLWWAPFYERLTTRAAILDAARTTPLVYPPGTGHTYSDLGFLALGAVLEDAGGTRLDSLWSGPLRWGDARAEPTEGGLRGLVHDDNARAMGGVAPHAGLFGSAWEVAKVARRWLVGEVPGADGALRTRGRGSHVLGWDTPSGEQSSAGASPPADAVGHTGFTGTSVWMSHSRDFIAVLLTNRVAYGRDPSRIRALRHAWHQVAWGAVSSAARRSTPP